MARKLRDFALEIEITAATGETLVLMGNNGSGKTTVLNLVAGLVTPDEGVIEIAGRTLYSSVSGVDLPPEQRDIGYVFQSYALFPHMTVYDNVAFGLRMRGIPEEEIRRRVRGELEPVGMWELRQARAPRLSGGQKQKVALARALVTEPSLLMLDEPLSALDMETQAAVRQELKARIRRAGIPAIVITHDVADAREFADIVYVLDRGRIRDSGKPGNIFK